MESLHSLDINIAFYLKVDEDGWHDENQLQNIKQRIYDALQDIGDVEIDDSTLQCID